MLHVGVIQNKQLKKKKVVLSTCKEGYLTIMNTVLFHCTGVEKKIKKNHTAASW